MLVTTKNKSYKTLRAIYVDNNENVIVDGEKMSVKAFNEQYVPLSAIIKEYKSDYNLGSNVTKKHIKDLVIHQYGSARVIPLMLKDRGVIIVRGNSAEQVRAIVHKVLNSIDQDLEDLIEMYDLRYSPNGIPITLPK